MDISQLYQFVLILVLVGMVIGVGVLVLDKFAGTDGVTTSANTSITAARDAVGGIATNWMSLIVTIGVLALILGLVIAGFSYARGGRR